MCERIKKKKQQLCISYTVLRMRTEVSAWIDFLWTDWGQHPGWYWTENVFLEQCWGLEGERLLKARPHTNVRYSNEQSGPSEYHFSFAAQASYTV